MPAPGRNEPCPCGSGRKVKRCCGQRKGPSDLECLEGFLRGQSRAAAVALADHHDDEDIVELRTIVVALPGRYNELVLELPSGDPIIESLRRAMEQDDLEAGAEVMAQAIARVDDPLVRVRLSKRVAALRADGHLDPCVADAALFDLGLPVSLLIGASLVQALLVETGGLLPAPTVSPPLSKRSCI